MGKIIFSLYDTIKMADKMADHLHIEKGIFDYRSFPDEETYIRIRSDVKNKEVIILCFLDHPNDKILTLYFLAKRIKELGSSKITLIIPYLPYMRQDKEFNPGEAITSHSFAELLSSICDSLLTIDPHLHRIKDLSEIFSARTLVLHTAPTLAEWLNNNVKNPLIIGPDEESTQWLSEVATLANLPFIIATKKRLADTKVIIDLPDISDNQLTPVIIDDIISSGTTMCVLIECLLKKNFKPPICIGIHALFSQKNYQQIMNVGAKEIISCNTIIHPTNHIDILPVILNGITLC